MRSRFFILLWVVSASCVDRAGPTSESGVDASIGDHDAAAAADVAPGNARDAEAPVDAAVSPSPLTIFGPALTLWLDATQSSTVELDDVGRLATWRDRSGKNTETRAYYPQPTGRIDLVQGAINGHPAMRFYGTSAPTGSLGVDSAYGVADFVLSVVVAYTGDSEAYVHSPHYRGTDGYGIGPDGAWIIANRGGVATKLCGGYGTTSNGQPVAGAVTDAGGWNDGMFHVVTVRRENAKSAIYLRVDGVETSAPLTETSPKSATYAGVGYVGGYPLWPLEGPSFVASPLDGMIAEVIRAQTSGTPSELAALEQYLRAKYAFTF